MLTYILSSFKSNKLHHFIAFENWNIIRLWPFFPNSDEAQCESFEKFKAQTIARIMRLNVFYLDIFMFMQMGYGWLGFWSNMTYIDLLWVCKLRFYCSSSQQCSSVSSTTCRTSVIAVNLSHRVNLFFLLH